MKSVMSRNRSRCWRGNVNRNRSGASGFGSVSTTTSSPSETAGKERTQGDTLDDAGAAPERRSGHLDVGCDVGAGRYLDRHLSRFTLSRNMFRPPMAGLTLGFLLPRRELGDQCELDLDPARHARASLLNQRSAQSSGL
jgi:hypothetical protein